MKAFLKRACDAFFQTSAANPLVHTITNFVTVNDCANIILAAGGAPTMAHDRREVEEVAASAQALVLNLGAIEDLEAMLLAAAVANRRKIPIVLDPVAAGATALRRESCQRLLAAARMTVIRGNASEIRALALGSSECRGVDVGPADRITEETLPQAAAMTRALAARLQCVVAVSGAVDLVSDGQTTVLLRGGCPAMSRITGSGCMLTALLGAVCGANPAQPFVAAVAAAGAMGLAGELGWARTSAAGGGNASFATALIDAVYRMTPQQFEGGVCLEAIP